MGTQHAMQTENNIKDPRSDPAPANRRPPGKRSQLGHYRRKPPGNFPLSSVGSLSSDPPPLIIGRINVDSSDRKRIMQL
ncbi:hypothetical protein EVAR_51806_1 [Eumeta japonica]|uniref:Uncharacterized protein n=1 Tax=Eumeta variegata TaxID=151549 RepID=A0A4C1XZL5_EUMVA|nr:hypothetical protein EVAR_51806_1 [Eumeta japonica]